MSGARASFKGPGQGQILQLGKVAGWLRLAQSTVSGGEWTSIADIINPGSPMVQTDSDRRAAVGTTANGLPTMLFDGTDVHLLPQVPALSSTTRLGMWLWYKPATLVGFQLLIVNTGTLKRFDLYQNNATLIVDAYVNNSVGRSFATAATLTAGAWHAIYAQYDSGRGGDPNVVLQVGGVAKSLTPTALGGGGAASLTVLQAASGNMFVGGGTDTDAPSSPIVNLGEIGPNIFLLNDNLTAAEELILRSFEVPT